MKKKSKSKPVGTLRGIALRTAALAQFPPKVEAQRPDRYTAEASR